MKKKKENKDLDHGFPDTLQEGVDLCEWMQNAVAHKKKVWPLNIM